MIIEHKPALLTKCKEFLRILPSGVYVDCTIGLGGHSEMILEETKGSAKVVGIDLDEDALEFAKIRLQKYSKNVKLINDNFCNLKNILNDLEIKKVDGIILDLGLSSLQLEDKNRGFTFLKDAPLDMRMSKITNLRAADIVNCFEEHEIEKIFREFGEERKAGKIAHRIIKERKNGREFKTTVDFANFVRQVVGEKNHGTNSVARIFQSLRIATNNELTNLKKIMTIFHEFLQKGGRIVVISFHSLEDRIVKQSFLENAKNGTIKILTKKPIRPSKGEVEKNQKVDSAKLRAAEKN